jgi:hypothetical protein
MTDVLTIPPNGNNPILAQPIDNKLTPGAAYSMTPDGKGRFLIAENGRQIARVFTREDALRVVRALADADNLQARIAALETQPVSFLRKIFRKGGK